MLTTCPCLALRRSRIAARVIHIKPSTLPFHMPTQSSSTAFSIGARPRAPPALLTSTSIRPNLFDTSPTKDSMLALLVTSSSIARPSSPATRLRRSRRRAPTTIWKPRRPSATAVAAPMPDEAPVMTATGVDLFVPLPPYAAYPRENAAGAPRRVRRRPPGIGRRRRDDGTQPDELYQRPPQPAPPRQSAFGVPEPAARGLAARPEREDAARGRGGRSPVQLAARSWSRRAFARGPKRGRALDQQRAGRPLRPAELTPQGACPQHRGGLRAALEGAIGRAAHGGAGPLRAARAAALQASLDGLSAEHFRLHRRR